MNIFKYFRLPVNEIESYYRENRYKRYERNGAYITNLFLHTIFHYPLITLLKVSRITKGIRVVVVNNEKIKTNKPIIFTPTHIGGDDIVIAFETLRDASWLFIGDPHDLYRNIDWLLLKMNGVIEFDTGYKQDRKIAKERAETLLKKGGNLLLFPEGAWNVTKNKIVCPLYAGAVELAIKNNAEIVPVAILRCNNTYYVDVGRNINYSEATIEQRFLLTDDLRNVLSTMQWNLMSIFSQENRENISDSYYLDVFWKEILGDNSDCYTMQEALDTMFYPKGITENAEAFAHISLIEPNMTNAFLFSKRNHD